MRELYSCLASLLRDQIPESLGFDADCHAIVAQDAEKLFRMEEDARGAQCSLTGGLAVFGKLLLCREAAAELEISDVQTIGDFIVTLAESLHQLAEMERGARDGREGIAARPAAKEEPATDDGKVSNDTLADPEPAPTVPPLTERQLCLVGLLKASFSAKDGEGHPHA